MALTIPNSFTGGQKIEGVKIQENVDAIKKYLNGGIVSGDISTAEWVDVRHIMKGVYFSTNNSYEMVSGLQQGPPLSELPVFNPGYAGKVFGISNGNPVPGGGISFYLEEEADVIFKYQISPRGLPLNAGVSGAALEVRLDDVVNNLSQNRFSKEEDIGPQSGVSADLVGFYRRRFYQVEVVFPVVSKGYHNIQLNYRGNLRAVPLKFCSYSLEAYYRP
tara:strand:+ start:985 stop:1641 length:657 start_codon:yes stop_codon:yes gene_type:complete